MTVLRKHVRCHCLPPIYSELPTTTSHGVHTKEKKKDKSNHLQRDYCIPDTENVTLRLWGKLCPQKICGITSPWYLWLWHYLEKDLCRCNHIKMKSFWMRVASNPGIGVFIRERRGSSNTWTQRHEDIQKAGKTMHLTLEAEPRVMAAVGQRMPNDCRRPPETRTRQGRILPCSLQRETGQPCLHLDF